MKRLLFGMAVGAVAGALAFRKMEDKQLPEKVLKCAKELQDSSAKND